MTEFPEKSKRKQKPARLNHQYISMIVVVVGIFLMMIIFVTFLFTKSISKVNIQPVRCEIDASKYYLDDSPNQAEYLGLRNLLPEFNEMLGFVVTGGQWLDYGKTVIYKQIDHTERGGDITVIYNIETGGRSAFWNDITYNLYVTSPDGRYFLQDEGRSNVMMPRSIRIIDVYEKQIVMESKLTGSSVFWSPESHYIYQVRHNDEFDVIIDLTTNDFIDLAFMDDSTTFIGWVDDTQFLYRDAQGELITYNIMTQESERNIEGLYPIKLDQIHNPYRFEGQKIGMVDEESNYWIIDLETQTRKMVKPAFDDRIPYYVGNGRSLSMEYSDRQLAEVLDIESGNRAIVEQDHDTHFPVTSLSGNYFYHWLNQNGQYFVYIQDFRTGDKIILDSTRSVDAREWVTIDGQDYLYFVQPIDDNPDVYMHYLYHPETMETCLVTESLDERLVWQP